MTQAALRIEKLEKSYQGKPVLQGLSLRVEPGELCVLIGRSGCGKSTLLRCVQGLEAADSGLIEIAGKRVGLVFQDFNLFPHLNLLNNVALAPRLRLGLSHDQAQERARRQLTHLGLNGHELHYPSQISGGQAQRAAIARALALEPEILLYDEPTASLDPDLTQEVLKAMLTLKKEGMTQLVVTHEHAFALKAADQVAYVDEGCVLECGPAKKIFKNPRHPKTKAFVRGRT